MDKNERRNVLSDTLNRIIMLTQACDTKASIILGVVGILIGAVLSTDSLKALRLYLRMAVKNPSGASISFVILFIISTTTMIAGVVCMGGVIFPRLSSGAMKGRKIQEKSKSKRKEQDLSLIYFGDISRIGKDDYKKEVKSADDNKWISEYVDEIRICSKICNSKFKWYRTGMLFLCGSACSFVICIVLLIWR